MTNTGTNDSGLWIFTDCKRAVLRLWRRSEVASANGFNFALLDAVQQQLGFEDRGIDDTLVSRRHQANDDQCSSFLTFSITKRVPVCIPWLRRSQVRRVGVLGAALIRDWRGQSLVSTLRFKEQSREVQASRNSCVLICRTRARAAPRGL